MPAIKVYAIVNSDTIGTSEVVINGPPTSTYDKKDVRQIISGWDVKSPKAVGLINLIINERHDEIRQFLKQFKDEWYMGTSIHIYYDGAKKNLANYTTVSKSGKRVMSLPPDKPAYIKPETFIKRYRLAGNPKKLPFLNYDTNDTGEKNCVYEYVKKTYGITKRIGMSKIDKYFNKDIVYVEDVVKFCDDYKIKLQLWSLEKVILTNKYYDDKNHHNKNCKDFVAIICNNHLYPHIRKDKDTKGLTTPILSDEPAKDLDITKNVLFIKNDKITITEDGKIEENQAHLIENAFFKNITPNFSYKSEAACKIQSLMYIDPILDPIQGEKSDEIKEIEEVETYEVENEVDGKFVKVKYVKNPKMAEDINKNAKKVEYEEYDINKAYYTMATEIIKPNEECPVFTASSIWEKYDSDDDIIEYDYYLLSEKGLLKCKKYGLINNMVMGHFANLLLNKKIIGKQNIKYVKHATYTTEWSVIQRRINEVKEKCNIKDEYIFYNGILGIVNKHNNITYAGIVADDVNLLNYNRDAEEYDDKWVEDGIMHRDSFNEWGEAGFTATKTTHTFKYINTVNIYNYVISRCNLFLLEVLFDTLENNDNLKVIKIKVDALIFDRPIKISPKYAKYFKTVANKDICKKYFDFQQTCVNGKALIKEINKELDCFDKNISFSGAPGTGKTTKVKDNFKFDIATTTTNLCLLNLVDDKKLDDDDENAVYRTTYSLFNLWDPSTIHEKFRKLRNKTIWIDEFSMIPAYVWGFVHILSNMYNCKFILSGDMNQIGPIGENKINIEGAFYKRLFCNMENLTQNHRNDIGLVQLRDFVLGANWGEIKKRFETLYDDAKEFLKYKRHISFTHETKDMINYLMLKHNKLNYKWTNEAYIDKAGKKKYTSTLEVDEGVILSCFKSSKSNGLFKNDIWEVVDKLEDGYRLKNLIRENKFLNVPMKNMVAFTLGYCTTAHSSQGLTITDDMCIHDIDKMINMDKAILYTAITRGRYRGKLHLFKNGQKYADHGLTGKSYDMTITVPYDKLVSDDNEFDKYEKMRCIN